MSVKKRGLGRGLDALLTPRKTAEVASDTSDLNDPSATEEQPSADNSLRMIAVSQLTPGKYQPRKDMSESALEELSRSIQSQGIIQPIVVRAIKDGQYEIIAGERRWRAAKLAELTEIPCLIKDVPDEAAVAIALIENIQREDLNAMEEAIALQRLMTEFELTHQAVADAVGKSRTAVSNLLRLNSLNDEVKTLLERGDIEMGHARALLAVEGPRQSELGLYVAQKGLTVRETEALVKKAAEPELIREPVIKAPDIELLEQQLSQQLKTSIAIKHNAKGKGKLTINYKNLAELDKIIEYINR